jgi:hypothetical protein
MAGNSPLKRVIRGQYPCGRPLRVSADGDAGALKTRRLLGSIPSTRTIDRGLGVWHIFLMPSRDLEKNRAYVRAHYYRHKERVLAKVRVQSKKTRAKRRDWLTALKAERGCAHCGERDPVVLEFHHSSGEKEFAVARMTPKSMKAILAEIDKCTVLCANCHLREHERLRRATGGTADAPVLGTGVFGREGATPS